ncbi:hypothetical protein HDC92_000596 [Pedobacter sp. AK017]|nr:hypothetical protein [Pedobacter sp. AK017]
MRNALTRRANDQREVFGVVVLVSSHISNCFFNLNMSPGGIWGCHNGCTIARALNTVLEASDGLEHGFTIEPITL